MLISLITTALLMGLAGIPHCAAMCATPCAVATPTGLPVSALLGRTVGYAFLGGLAAGATVTLASWSRFSVVLQPFWVMLLAASALLGAWMLIRGEMPLFLQSQGLAAYRALQRRMNSPHWLTRHPRLANMLPAVLGAAWAALPCGLLYGAVTVAALASSAWQGACVMAAFSLPGAVALWWWPRQLKVWQKRGAPQGGGSVGEQGGPSTGWQGSALQSQALVPVLWMRPDEARGLPPPVAQVPEQASWWLKLIDPLWAMRLSGLCLAGASSWALWHRLMDQWRAWCA
jgi:sulfite exporter TauE/SafE